MRICFLEAHRLEGGAVRGAALVTDERTRPLEFRVTDPIVATDLQRVLYGAVLDEHLLGDLCSAPLLDSLHERPDCVIVRDDALLSLQELRTEPVLWIGRDDAATANSDDSGGFVLGFHGDGENPAMQAVRTRLREAAATYDLLEPFARIVAAVEHVHRSEVAAAS